MVETKNVLVTGGAGFLGSHLVDWLVDKGHNVTVVDDLSGGYEENVNPKATFLKCCITNRDAIDHVMDGQEIVFHLAAHAAEGQSVFCPLHNAKTNYIGSVNLLNAAINKGVKRFVFTSSMARYGTQEELPMHEGQLARPDDPYGITKESFEQLLRLFTKVYGMEHVILVPHNIFGERQNLADPYRNVIGIFMNRILRGKPPIIYGDGLQKRAFSYVEDCKPYLAKAGFQKNVVGETINIGPDEEPTTIKKLADMIIDVMGYKGKPMYMPERPLEVKFAWCSADKARNLLGYKTSHTLKQGLDKMAKWAKKKGPQELKYWDKLEISHHKVPEVWSKKLL